MKYTEFKSLQCKLPKLFKKFTKFHLFNFYKGVYLLLGLDFQINFDLVYNKIICCNKRIEIVYLNTEKDVLNTTKNVITVKENSSYYIQARISETFKVKLKGIHIDEDCYLINIWTDYKFPYV